MVQNAWKLKLGVYVLYCISGRFSGKWTWEWSNSCRVLSGCTPRREIKRRNLGSLPHCTEIETRNQFCLPHFGSFSKTWFECNLIHIGRCRATPNAKKLKQGMSDHFSRIWTWVLSELCRELSGTEIKTRNLNRLQHNWSFYRNLNLRTIWFVVCIVRQYTMFGN